MNSLAPQVERNYTRPVTYRFGKYQLHKAIGRGGMAEVWLANRHSFAGVEKRVIIKRIHREKANDSRLLELFVKEAQISMALTHKNIVSVFDFGRVKEELFLVMDYVDGPNLGQALSEARKTKLYPSSSLVAHIIFEACQALHYAHLYRNEGGQKERISHLDVTPQNLFLSFAGEVKLGDFGLAAVTADLTQVQRLTHGTPAYLAPEQANRAPLGPCTDIYSLGLILREALEHEPLRSGSIEDKISQAKEALPPISSHLPEALRSICDRATRLERSERYQSAKEMAEDLDNFLLHSRVSNPDDRRVMPQRLATWLEQIFPKGLSLGEATATPPSSDPVTFLDNGADDILDPQSNATERSMAETFFSQEEKQPSQSVILEANEERGKRVFPVRTIGFATLAVGLIVFVLLYTKEDYIQSPTRASNGQIHLPISDSSHISDASQAPSMDASPTMRSAALSVLDGGETQKAKRIHSSTLPAQKFKREVSHTATTLVSLRLSTTPWARVSVLNRKEKCQETPCTLKLPPGNYQLVLYNPVTGFRKHIKVTLRPNSARTLHAVLSDHLK